MKNTYKLLSTLLINSPVMSAVMTASLAMENDGRYSYPSSSSVETKRAYTNGTSIEVMPFDKFIKDHITGRLQPNIRRALEERTIDKQFVYNLGYIDFKLQETVLNSFKNGKLTQKVVQNLGRINFTIQETVLNLFNRDILTIDQLLILGNADLEQQPLILFQMFPNQ